jgi:hypothetical protein
MNIKTAVLLASTLLPCAANAQGYLPYQAYQGYRGAPAPQLPQAPYQTQPAFNPYPAAGVHALFPTPTNHNDELHLAWHFFDVQ